MIERKSWGVLAVLWMAFIIFVSDGCKRSSEEEESEPIAETVVYVAGRTRNSSDVFIPCYWKNGARTDLGAIDTSKDGYGGSIYVSSKGDVYVAGFCRNASNVWVPCYWKNGARTDLSVIDATKNSYGHSIFVSLEYI